MKEMEDENGRDDTFLGPSSIGSPPSIPPQNWSSSSLIRREDEEKDFIWQFTRQQLHRAWLCIGQFARQNSGNIVKVLEYLGKNPITSDIGGADNGGAPFGPIHPHHSSDSQQLGFASMERQTTPTGVFSRWNQYTKKAPSPPKFKSKPGTLVCSRPLFLSSRSHSRQGQCSSKEQPAELDDDDFDSVSTVSGIFTPYSTVTAADQAKIGVLEQQLAALQKQMAQLLQQQPPTQPQEPPPSSKPTSAARSTAAPPPAPPPPPPPLLPSLRADLARAANSLEKPPKVVVADEKSDQINSNTPSPPPVPASTPASLVDILKDIGSVKLKKVNRGSPAGTLAKAKKALENDTSLAGALARALGERRKKLKLDSEDGEPLDESRHKEEEEESNGGWSDDGEGGEEKENNGGGGGRKEEKMMMLDDDDEAFIQQQEETEPRQIC